MNDSAHPNSATAGSAASASATPVNLLVLPLIAVVEDEEHLARGLIFNLELEGYRVHHEADGEQALQWLLQQGKAVDAVLLDVMLPGRDGFSIVQELRSAQNFVPVLMLTARGRPEDVLQGFDAGADDYLSKPFELSILLARLKSLLRRMNWHRTLPENLVGATTDAPIPSEAASPSADAAGPARFSFAGREIDFDALEIRAFGKTTRLTLMEADLLRHLVRNAGRIVSRKEILEQVWRVREDTDTRAIDNFIVRLRRYIEADPAHPVHLETVRGVGYRFIAEGTDKAG